MVFLTEAPVAPSIIAGKAGLPGNDANSRTSNMTNTADNFGFTSQATGQVQDGLSATGVSILGFKSESIAREAGMQKGDVIVEYDGKGNLTTDKLAALTAMTKPEGIQVCVVFMRDEHEHSTLAPPGPLGISVLDTTIRPFSGSGASDDPIDAMRRLGLWIVGAFSVLVLLAFGAAALGLFVISSWENLAFLVLMMFVAAMFLGWLFDLIYRLFSLSRVELAVVLLFIGGAVVNVELIRPSQDGLVIFGLMFFSGTVFFVLLCCAIHFIPFLREGQGSLLGMGIGMWTGYGISYALWGPNWDWFLFRFLSLACTLTGLYLGYKIVDEKSKQ